MDARADDLIRHYREMRAATLAAIAGLGPGEMSDPAIDGWSVKDHLAHVALWDEIRAAEIERISHGFAAAWRIPEEDHILSDLGYRARRSLPLDQVLWEFARSHRGVLDALAAATERGLDGALYGEAGLRSTHEAAHAGWILRWRQERERKDRTAQ